jgi:cytidyltransferase-like protein
MNLGQYLVQQLLEAKDKQTIAVFPGAFKPPHRGHFAVVKKLLENADQVVVLISPKTREGVTADESVAVWELYKTLLDNNVEIRVALENPVRETYDLVKNNPDTNFIVAFGKDDASRFKRMDYPNAKVFDAGTVDAVNATGLRNAIQSNNAEAIAQFIPDGINLIDFTNTIGKKTPPAEDKGEEVTIQEKQFQNVDDAYEKIVKDERSEIERVAQEFNVPIPDVEYAFVAGNMVVLSDDVWSKLENTDSWDVKSLEDAIALASKYGKNWKPTLAAIKADKAMNPPLILNYDKDKYHLVGGNTRLMFLKALGKIPKVLMATLNLGQPKQTKLMEVKKLNESETGTIGEFLKYAIKNLGIQNPPRNLSLSYDTAKAKEMRSFGYFDPNSNKIWVYCGNRNMGDILRTLAHELVHRKQDEDGRISYESGKTGSEIENEANAKAGVLLRDFGKQHEEIYQ